MKPKHPYGAVAMRCVVFLALVACMHAQEATSGKQVKHTGVPQDWSHGHIVFSRDGLAQHPEIMDREPRVLFEAMQRWRVPNPTVFHAVAPAAHTGNARSHRDWNVTFPAGRIFQNMFPVKFNIDPSLPPSCLNDFVVFGLDTPGVDGGHPNLVAFNNLYVNATGTGFCAGLFAPTVLFAYNITTVPTGRINTSPILSLDGKQIGFVESVPGATPSATFHVLTWHAGDGTLAAAAPAPLSMTSLTYAPGADSTTSSPYIDYSSNVAYLGADNGLVYKITGVFGGTTPTLAPAPWPVSPSAPFHLTPPVLDARLGALMVGSANGNLYKIDIATGTVTGTWLVGLTGSTSPGIVAPPIVDIVHGTTFVISADDGAHAVLVEADTAVSGSLLARAPIGLGATGGTALNILEPAFDNNYYNDPSTGQIRTCGTKATDTSPWEYAFGFTGRTMHIVPAFSQAIPTNPAASTAARCSPMTEHFNPNIAGGTDFFLFGLTQDCTAPGAANGCVMELTGNSTFTPSPAIAGGPSGMVIDNFADPLLFPAASSIYMTARNANIAYKFTQSGLQ